LAESDTTTGARVVVVDEILAKQYWPNEDPLGQQVQRTDGTPPSTIVGIVGHVKPSIFASSPKGVMYQPMYQSPIPIGALIVRTAGNPDSIANGMKEAVHAVDPVMPVAELKSMDERVAATLDVRRFAVILLLLFAGVAVFIAALGLYGVISYIVTQRTQEIGIRMALGADRRQILRLVVREGVSMILIGTALGSIVASTLARLVSSQLFGVSSSDPATFAVTVILLLIVGVMASYIPARRATHVNPLEACRYE
jgi:ABC-type antimicrobial peptide transport system permease subunit